MISTCGRQPLLSTSSLSKPFRILLSPLMEWKDLCFVVRYKFPIAALFTAGLTSLAVLHLYPFKKKESKNKAQQLQSEKTHRCGARWTEQSPAHLTWLSHRRKSWWAGKRQIQPIRSLWEETGRGIPNKETGKLILVETRKKIKNCGHCFGTQPDVVQKH